MATIGQALTAPEAGWKRYDDTNQLFTFSHGGRNAWSHLENDARFYNSSEAQTNADSASVSFTFTGTKFRLIGATYTDKSTSVEVNVDGVVVGSYSQYSPTLVTQTLDFEKTDLSSGKHTVKITNKGSSGSWLIFDAIDIDSTGRLMHPDEVFNINDLVVGKRIRCNYKALISNSVGVFSGLGNETKDFIPVESSATPDGDFYYIMVEDWNGKKKLVADRNIQHSISWDVINTSGIASGSGLPTYYNLIKPMTSDDQTIAQANTIVSAGYYPYLAFDGRYSVDHQNATILSGTSGWISYDFKSNKKVSAYRIVGRRDGNYNYCPKNWTFEGWNGSTWDVLDTQTNITAWSDLLPKTFLISSPKPYSKYRINISANNGGVNTQITELEMLGVEYSANFTTRLLTGGTSSTDKDNEWDKYIVNSTLNGTITAGDNNVWNWSGVASLTSTSVGSSSAQKARRGQTANDLYANTTTSLANYGFRPVLIVETISQTKTLIKVGTSYKKYINSWQTVSETLPSVDTFSNEGMTNLTVLDRKLTTITQTMTSVGALGVGKTFKGTIDLKKYVQMISFNVK